MMLRMAALGALVFGVSGFVAGYLWNLTDVPYFVFIPWAIGWAVIGWRLKGGRSAVLAGVIGGVSFTAALLVGLFFAITDGSPLPIAGWMAAGFAGAVAGALTALVIDRKAAGIFALAAGVGMVLGTVVGRLVPALSPVSVDTPGQAQAIAFAIQQGIVSGFAGAAIGWAATKVAEAKPVEVRAQDERRGA